MPVLPLDGEIPATPVDYLDFGESNEVKCPDCEGGTLSSRGHLGFGTIMEDCNTCDGKGVL